MVHLGHSVVRGRLAGPLAGLHPRVGRHGRPSRLAMALLIEGIPGFASRVRGTQVLARGPERAAWLTDEEKRTIAARIVAEEPRGESDLWSALIDARVLMLGLANFTYQVAALGAGSVDAARSCGLWASPIAPPALSQLRSLWLAPPRCSSVDDEDTSRGERIWHAAIPWLFAGVRLRGRDEWTFGLACACRARGWIHGAFCRARSVVRLSVVVLARRGRWLVALACSIPGNLGAFFSADPGRCADPKQRRLPRRIDGGRRGVCSLSSDYPRRRADESLRRVSLITKQTA